MANARKKLVVLRSIDERPLPDEDMMAEAISLCKSGRLIHKSTTAFELKIEFARPEEEQFKTVDLAEYHLPETSLLEGCTLSEERTLAIATVLAVDSHLLNVGSLKGTHKTVVNLVSTLAKLWEWGRLQSLYHPRDWTPSHFLELGELLGAAKWTLGMQLDKRVDELLLTKPEAGLIVREASAERAVLRRGTSALLHTNLSVQELGSVRAKLLRYAGCEGAEPWAPTRPTFSWMVQTLRAINELVRIPRSFGFPQVPYSNPFKQAKKLAVAGKRTKNLTVEQAIGLLVHSYDWVQNKAGATIALIDEVGRIAKQVGAGQQTSKARLKLADELWRSSTVRASAEKTLGFPVQMVRVDRISHAGAASVAHVVDCLMSSAFVLIAGLNARRKDEISHPTLGLTRDSMRVINEGLDIYQGDFYILKSLKDYAPYFVNRASYDAFLALCEIENAQQKTERLLLPKSAIPKANHSLFWRRSYVVTDGRLGERVWYQFELGGNAATSRFLNEALEGGISTQGTAAHMFRRFYAIIYFYRFEHATLLHLRYQLAHLTLETVPQYVSDAVIAQVANRISIGIKKNPEEVRAAVQSEWRDLGKEIAAVGNEKLHESIKALIGGASASGGFPALLLRLQRRLSADVDYSSLDMEAQAKRLAAVVTRRGHAIQPLLHGDCLAGQSPARSARCAKLPGAGPARENATPIVCSKCSLHWVSEGHLEGQKLDLALLDREIDEAVDTVQSAARLRERENLQKVIWLHEARIK